MADHSSYVIKKIGRLIGAFDEQINIISGLENRLYKQILFVSLLDALSRIVFPRDSNRKRFVRFVSQFASWKNGDSVSLPHLVQLLNYAPEPCFEKIRLHAHALIKQWAPGELIILNRDPKYAEIARLWPAEKDNPRLLEGVSLDALQHVNLLYTFRNSLVHEFRPLGYGMEFEDDVEPYYMIMTSIDESQTGQQTSWELVYPITFLKAMCKTCLLSLRTYLEKNNIDPYSSFTFGSYWISELNR